MQTVLSILHPRPQPLVNRIHLFLNDECCENTVKYIHNHVYKWTIVVDSREIKIRTTRMKISTGQINFTIKLYKSLKTIFRLKAKKNLRSTNLIPIYVIHIYKKKIVIEVFASSSSVTRKLVSPDPFFTHQ